MMFGLWFSLKVHGLQIGDPDSLGNPWFVEAVLNSENGDDKLENLQGEVSWPWNWSPKRVE